MPRGFGDGTGLDAFTEGWDDPDRLRESLDDLDTDLRLLAKDGWLFPGLAGVDEGLALIRSVDEAESTPTNANIQSNRLRRAASRFAVGAVELRAIATPDVPIGDLVVHAMTSIRRETTSLAGRNQLPDAARVLEGIEGRFLRREGEAEDQLLEAAAIGLVRSSRLS